MTLDYGLTAQIMAVILLLYLAWGQIKLFAMMNAIGNISAHTLQTLTSCDCEDCQEELLDKVTDNEGWREWDEE